MTSNLIGQSTGVYLHDIDYKRKIGIRYNYGREGF